MDAIDPQPLNSQSARELAKGYSYYIRRRVILITGVSPGSIGAEFLKAIIVEGPAELILAGRNRDAMEETAQTLAGLNSSVRLRLLSLDLMSLDATRKAAEEVMGWIEVPHIDILVNSAGIMAKEWTVSVDGYESQLATNHLGSFLFTNLIMSKILKSEAPRIVMVTSHNHRFSPFRFADYNFQGGETYNMWQAYGQSKTANSLIAIYLANKVGTTHNLMAFSVNPGCIKTNLDSHIDWEEEWSIIRNLDRFFGNREGFVDTLHTDTLDCGAANFIYAAFDPYLWPHNGSYLQERRVGDPWSDTIKPWTTSLVEAERLWALSEGLVGQRFKY